jgi:gamma-glutamyltranspeptidase/glutathione hydrolase
MNSLDVLKREPNMARVFLPNGKVPAVGTRHKQPELAATLERIAKLGRDGFYKGPVADDMVSYLRGLGGHHTPEDFAHARGEYVEPIRTTYRGHQVYECPPNGQGITALIFLNILSGLSIDRKDPLSVERLHMMIEASRLAYADRNAFVADPAKSPVPTEDLLSKRHADELRAKIDPDRAATVKPVELAAYHDTVYLCVVDKDRNAVSFINSLYHSFGSGLMAPKSGVVLQNRGQGFVVKPGHPNCVAPGKRPMHTIIPGMLVKDGRALAPFGVMGGQFQAYGHVHLLTNILDFGLDVQDALDLPRLFPNPGDKVVVEKRIPEAAVKGLQKRGHQTQPAEKPHGGGQTIFIDWKEGVLTGGSEPRKDGCAIGY